MNLADAIRKAANKGLVGDNSSQWSDDGSTVVLGGQEAPAEKQLGSPFVVPESKQVSHTAPTIPDHGTQTGNAVRLEIFLSGEQMTGMLKAIMAGQHSVLTLREAASYLRIGSNTLLKLAEEGEIPAVEIDGRYRFPKSNLDDWLAVQSMAGEEGQDVA